MKRIIKNVCLFTIILLILSSNVLATDIDFKQQIKSEEGSLFEKIIAECIGGIAQTILDFTTNDVANVGFKDYDTLIFNNNAENDALSPFTEELWNKTMDWYKIFALISGTLILIAVFILAYKMIFAAMNTLRKNEAKENLSRLLFGAVAIAFAPLFIKFLLYLNNSLVHLMVTAINGSLDGLLGNSVLTSVKTGNAITTALVIAMFIYLFVKLNIKFIVRQFTIIIFTIFTPLAAGLWIINKNVTAISIWAGQLIMNIFMQFIYCFLFLVYLTFLPTETGWAISLIWAMMILPLADALQNSFQNLTSRIAGVDNDQVAGRALGIGGMLGYSVGTIKEQFKTQKMNNDENGNRFGGMKGMVERAKNIVNPSMNLSAEKDYNSNVNPIRNVTTKDRTENNVYIGQNNKKTNSVNEQNRIGTTIGKIVHTGASATKAYWDIGAKMAEGDFNKSSYSTSRNIKNNSFNNSGYDTRKGNEIKSLGGNNEFKEENKESNIKGH